MQNKIIEGFCVGGKVREVEMYLNSLEEKCFDNYFAMIKGFCEVSYILEVFEFFVKFYR